MILLPALAIAGMFLLSVHAVGRWIVAGLHLDVGDAQAAHLAWGLTAYAVAGLVLGAVWVALPNIRKAPRWLLSGAAVLAAVLIVRPRLLLYAFPVAVVVAVVGATTRSGARRGK